MIKVEKETIINNTKAYVSQVLSQDSSGHDWWHIYRVWKLAKHIAKKENANIFIVELAALLHDIADWKFHDGDLDIGPATARKWLKSQDVADDIIEQVCDIIKNVSFKGANVAQQPLSLEGQVVQDADRLDALGAIGIGRTFAYGGHKGRKMYDPNIPHQKHDSFEAYQKSEGTTLNHFYEKLFLLKDRMNTKTGQALANERHQIMENFVEQFLKEWDDV